MTRKLSFKDLLRKNRFASIHHINLRTLAVQLFLTLLTNLNMLSKLGNLIYVHAKFIYKILDICCQQKKRKSIKYV